MKTTVAGTDNYTGLKSISKFSITPKNVKDDITVSEIKNIKDVENLVVRDKDNKLVKGTDYDVEMKKDGNKTTVTLTFKGNYTGTIKKSFTIEPKQNPQDKPKEKGSVETGDNTQTGLFATLGMMSAGCIALLAGKKRKKNRKEEDTLPL